MRTNEDENARKLSIKRGSLGANSIPLSPSLSTSPSTGKTALSSSRPSSGRNSKQARVTPSTASTNNAGKSTIVYLSMMHNIFTLQGTHNYCDDCNNFFQKNANGQKLNTLTIVVALIEDMQYVI